MGNTKLGAKLRVFMKWLNFSLIPAKILVRRTSEVFYVRFNKCVQEIVNKFALSGLGRRSSVLVSRRSGRRARDCGSNVGAEKNRGPDSRRLDSGYLQTRPSSLADVSHLHPCCPRMQLSRLNMASCHKHSAFIWQTSPLSWSPGRLAVQ